MRLLTRALRTECLFRGIDKPGGGVGCIVGWGVVRVPGAGGQSYQGGRGECGLGHYVLDIALVNGETGVVELNPIWNFGWYASSPERVLEASLLAI